MKNKAHPIKHFRTITKHRHKVIAHCFRVGIGFQGLFHDLSKYSPIEFISGAKHYTGKYSPHVNERKLYGHSLAWMHHKGRNRHHYEYWTDVDINTNMYAPVEMPTNYLAEMFCDRVAASKIYQGKNYTDASAYDYFMKGNAKDTMHKNTSKKLCEWLTLLKDEGEEVAFSEIKSCVKEYKKQKKQNKR